MNANDAGVNATWVKGANVLHLLSSYLYLYEKYRNFTLAKRISRFETTWEQAEKIAELCNTLVKTRVAEPQEFVKNENEKSDDLIDKYLELKKYLDFVKEKFGVPKRNQLHKAVKLFFRKKYFVYEMDAYFLNLAQGIMLLHNGLMTTNIFVNNYWCEYSLFDGSKKPLQLKKVLRIKNKIIVYF